MIIAQENLIFPKWQVAEQIRLVSTTRKQGVSLGEYAANNLGDNTEDEPEHIARNWSVLQHTLDYDLLAKVNQVHGTKVIEATKALQNTHDADAIWTNQPGIACAIRTADCLPIALVNTKGTKVAIAHCGWRGLAGNILTNTANIFDDKSEIHAWIGPGICKTCYQVDSKLYKEFEQYQESFTESIKGHWNCDLKSIAKKQLSDIGVASITDSGECTHCQPDRFYSHRANPKTGRIASLIWLKFD